MKEELLKVEEQFDQYILIGPGSDYGNIMWRDIGLLDKAIFYEKPLRSNIKILNFLHHLHFSFTINGKVQLPLQFIWKHEYSLENITFKKEKRYCVIYTDVSACRTDITYLSSLHKRKNVTMVLVLVNTMLRREAVIRNRLQYFDLIYSFDKRDADKYGFKFYPTFYSKTCLPLVEEKTDAFFVGVSKGRTERLNDIYKYISKNGGKATFFVSGVKKREMECQEVHYNKWLTYSEVLKKIAETRCIVEVMDGEQEGVTLRTMEAVCYNKKLLTNNQAVRKLSFYREDYIQVFDDIKNIDVDFIFNNEKVEYHYSDEFSPIHIIDEINKEIKI